MAGKKLIQSSQPVTEGTYTQNVSIGASRSKVTQTSQATGTSIVSQSVSLSPSPEITESVNNFSIPITNCSTDQFSGGGGGCGSGGGLETDPIFTGSPAYGISQAEINFWNSLSPYNLPIATASVLGAIKVGSRLNITPDGVLSGLAETDPLFMASPAHNIVALDITHWNAAYAYGPHTGLYQPLSSILTNTTASYTIAEQSKLSQIEDQANKYIHPVTHGPSIILQDIYNRFVTDAQIVMWNNKQNDLGYIPYDAANPAGYVSNTVNDLVYYYTITQTDNIFAGTFPVTGYNKTDWDTAYSWGNWAGHKHFELYQPNGTNPFVYTDNSGQLHIDGNIIQNGSAYETHAEHVYTKDNYIILRDGATAGLALGEYAGFKALKYDGLNDGHLVFDNTGTARVGDVGSEQPLTTRTETPTDAYIAVWDAAQLRLDFIAPTTYEPFITKSSGFLTWNAGWVWDSNTYSLSDHNHTGVYIPYTGATSNVNLGTHSLTVDTNTLFVDSVNHSVGIGTTTFTSPIAGTDIFQVASGAAKFGFNMNSNQPFFEVTDGTIKVFGGHVHSTDGAVFGAFTNHKLTLRTNNLNRLTIDTSGNVGIGYSSGTEITNNKLAVNGSVYGGSFVKSGGTSSQFLKADGSVDSNIYITSGTIPADVLIDGDFTSQGIMLRGATSGVYSILVDNSANWNTAYSWGNHTFAGYALQSALTTHEGLTTTAHGLGASAFHAEGYYQIALTNPVTGTGASGQVSFWNGTNTLTGDNGLFWDNTNKRLGVGTSSPTAYLHIKAGTTTAGTAPLKLTSGSLLTTPEVGAVEFLTDRFYATITTGIVREQFAFTSDLSAYMKTWATVPTTKTSTGTTGQVAYDANYFYICTATDTWTRASLATNW